jgi:hypothetical protein
LGTGTANRGGAGQVDDDTREAGRYEGVSKRERTMSSKHPGQAREHSIDERKGLRGFRAACRLAASVVAATALAAPAVAGTFRIDFYKGTFEGPMSNWIWDNDGIVDYTGSFVAPDSASPVAVSAFTSTIDGITYDTLAGQGIFPGPPGFSGIAGSPIPYISGIVFDTASSGPGDMVTVLQMQLNGDINNNFWGAWALSPCVMNSCGGGAFRGMYTISALENEIPTPGSLPLAALGLLALANVRRRAS